MLSLELPRKERGIYQSKVGVQQVSPPNRQKSLPQRNSPQKPVDQPKLDRWQNKQTGPDQRLTESQTPLFAPRQPKPKLHAANVDQVPIP
jgi:hypothetical protein